MDKPAHYSAANIYPEDVRLNGRYLITGQVWFLWRGPDGECRKGIGITHDIGETGVFIETESIPPLASPLKLVVALPVEWGPDIIVRLSGAGWVRHVRQGTGQSSGFGASAMFRTDLPMSTESTQESFLMLPEYCRPLLSA